MGLWIRSQDKRQLLKVNDGLYIANGFSDTDDTFIGLKNVGHIGRYAKEERALEILDEIQKLLQPQILIKKGKIAGSFDNTIIREADEFEIKELSTYVYEMPKE